MTAASGSGPLVSVAVPAYNAENTLEEAVRSALGQTHARLEVIIIDDGSTDATWEIALRLAEEDARVVPLRNERNRGVSFARNRAVELARGEWIAFLDSDDLWRADKLEKQLALLSRYPDAQLLYTGSAFIDAKGVPFTHTMRVPERVSYRALLGGNVISCSSAMARRDVLLRYPMENDRMHEDFAVWLKILRECPYAYGVDAPLIAYRRTPGSKSRARVKGAMMSYRTYRHMGYIPPWAALLVLRYTFYSVRKHSHFGRRAPKEKTHENLFS